MNCEHRFSERFTYFYCVNAALLAVGLFLHGFFPVKNVKGSFSSVNDLPMQLGSNGLNPDECYKQKVDKLVIMVIDAIRYDFVNSEEGETNMPFISSSINKNQACLFKLRANAPTVTMPRIKAITSGSVSNFVDVLMNFGSSEMLGDNIIDQASQSKYKIVFYGDDTWLKLFPKQFNRSEGTTSFFVSDYTEVDNNVTRNLDIELKKDDWDILILHYLGLDHIGHLDGPRSKLIKPKLNEMDDIVSKIHSYLINKETHENKATLLLVLGDHGMADFGGHGGTSTPEIIVPLISFGLGCGGIYETEIAQVDLASTLSVLLGIPIPADNVGQVILPFLTSSPSFSTADVLYALYYNAYQVVTQFLQNGGTILHEGYQEYWNAQVMHMQWLNRVSENGSTPFYEHYASEVIDCYKHALQLMSYQILKSAIDFHLMEMLAAIIILAQLFVIALFGVTFEVPSRVRLRIVSAIVGCATLLCWWMNLLDISCCLSSIYSVIITLSVIFIITFNSVLIANSQLSSVISNITELKPLNCLGCLLAVGTVIQTLSLASTSFIESEHLVWYHLFMFVLLSAMFISFIDDYNFPSSDSVMRNELNKHLQGHSKTILKCSLLLFIHRALKNYQECHYGVDIKWLYKLDSRIYPSIITFAGLISVIWSLNEISKHLKLNYHHYRPLPEKVLIGSCVSLIYYYRAVTGQVLLPFMVKYNSRGVIEVKLFFTLFILLFLLKVFFIKKYSVAFKNSNNCDFYPQYLVVEVVLTCWILLCSLLTRSYNIWLCSALLLTAKFFTEHLNNDAVAITVIHYWIGMLFYFYQGNSNFISSIDITAGYVGQNDYNAIIAGLFIAVNAFSFPVLSYLLLLITIPIRNWKSHLVMVYKVRSLILLMHLFFYLLLTTFQRYHLFVWSVFSPKLLYLTVNSIFIVILYWVTEAFLLLNKY